MSTKPSHREARSWHKWFSKLNQIDINTWLQIFIALLLAFWPVIVGGVFGNELVRFHVDKFSWLLWAGALGLFIVAIRSKPLPARLVALGLSAVVAGYALFFQTARPWCATVGVRFIAENASNPDTRYEPQNGKLIVPQGTELLITAEQRPTRQSGGFVGWGSVCTFSLIGDYDGELFPSAGFCQLNYKIGSKPADALVKIDRPSCTDSRLVTQQLPLIPKESE